MERLKTYKITERRVTMNGAEFAKALGFDVRHLSKVEIFRPSSPSDLTRLYPSEKFMLTICEFEEEEV